MGILVLSNGTTYTTGAKGAGKAGPVQPGKVAKVTPSPVAPSRLEKAAKDAATRPNIVEKGLQVDTLQRAARGWLDKAKDNSIDHEVRALYRDKAAKAVTEAERLIKELAGDLAKAPPPAPLAPNTPNQPVKPVNNDLANETQRSGYLAQADMADNEAIEHERRAEEKLDAVRRVSDQDLVRYYSAQARAYRAQAEECRTRAQSFRSAAEAL